MKTWILTYDDFIYMSQLLNAKYIDVDYKKKANLAHNQNEASHHLEKLGLIEEDFFGDTEISEVAKEIFTPIFFGKFESEYYYEDEMTLQHYKFHIHQDQCTQVKLESRQLLISTGSKDEMVTLKPDCKEVKERQILPINYFENIVPEGIMILKNIKIGKQSKVIQMVMDQGVFYRERYGKLYSVSPIDLNKLIERTLKGE